VEGADERSSVLLLAGCLLKVVEGVAVWVDARRGKRFFERLFCPFLFLPLHDAQKQKQKTSSPTSPRIKDSSATPLCHKPQTTRPQDNKTTRQQDNKTTRQQDNKTTRPQDNKTTRPQDNKTTRQQDNKTTRQQDNKTTRPQDNKTTRQQDNKTTRQQDNKTTRQQDNKTTRQQRKRCRVQQKRRLLLLRLRLHQGREEEEKGWC